MHATLFDHRVAAGEERGWDREAEFLGGSKIDDELEFCGLLGGRLAGDRPLQEVINVPGRLPKQVI